jgi:hypothetical protein
MRSVNTEVHLQVKVAPGRGKLNDVVAAGRSLGLAAARKVVAQVLWDRQAQELAKVWRGEGSVACPGCGVVHTGRGGLWCRGQRRRRLRTSLGRVEFGLRQVSCRACGATFCPFTARLGLQPRQRVAEELLEALGRGVVELSYQKTCALAQAWLGATVGPRTLWRAVQAHGARLRFTCHRPLGVLLVDGTRIRAGRRPLGEAAVLGVQVLGREATGNRPRARKRLIGFAVGRTGWDTVLRRGAAAAVVVTDAASGVRERVQAHCPHARHQLCEWHLAYTLQHFLGMQGMPVAARQAQGRALSAILRHRPAEAWPAYRAFRRRLGRYRKAATLLREAEPYILHPDRTVDHTTSLAEREMRELNRRTDVGVRWSEAGVTHLLRLKLAARLNPDDYARVWSCKHPVRWQVVPQPA